MMNLFKSSKGAVDLPSIIVGIIVVGVLAGITSVTVLGIIPWAQNNSARQALTSLSTAQNSYKQAYDVYGTQAQLVDKKLLAANDKTCSTISADGLTYASASKSTTGKMFANSSATLQTRQVAVGETTCFGVFK
jgi:type II secretory pathway pseudopilin PulG